MSGEEHDAVMHRRANAPDGKLTESLDLMVSSELLEAIVTLTHLKGYQNRSEYVRDVLHRHVYGEMEAIRMVARAVNRNPRNPG